MTLAALLLCLNLGFCFSATIVVMGCYWPNKKWWHIAVVGTSHLLLLFCALHTILAIPEMVPGWKMAIYLSAFTGTDVGLYLYLVRFARLIRQPECDDKL